MKNKLKIIVLFLLVIQNSLLFSQENKIELKKGNEYFEAGKFNLAKISYEKILETVENYHTNCMGFLFGYLAFSMFCYF